MQRKNQPPIREPLLSSGSLLSLCTYVGTPAYTPFRQQAFDYVLGLGL